MIASVNRESVFSRCRLYRYTLWRVWDGEILLLESDPSIRAKAELFVQLICLNPSTADEVRNDNTVTRCINYARAWGYGAMVMTNLFAWRATDPDEMMKVNDPVGVDNDFWIFDVASKADIVVCAWGNHGAHMRRGFNVLERLKRLCPEKLRFLKMNGTGHPQHPLYLRGDLQPSLYVS